MNKLFLMRNPELFQGEKYLNKDKNYFEGWYFKNANRKDGISFIPGISINSKEKKSFIQVITNTTSYFVNYNIDDFKFSSSPFHIKIANNYFSKDIIKININDTIQNLNICGEINYSNLQKINTNVFNPNIMGPFSYIPFMECNHAIISMKSQTNGTIFINDTNLDFDNGYAYIEKDWGCSFPKSYIWMQGNNFQNSNASFILSIADIPFKLFSFKGIICVLKINNREFRFTTYNNTKLKEYDVNKNSLNITLKRDSYYLNITSSFNNGHKLLAPCKGKMEKDIFENISSHLNITLKKENTVLFTDTSENCGLEIV